MRTCALLPLALLLHACSQGTVPPPPDAGSAPPSAPPTLLEKVRDRELAKTLYDFLSGRQIPPESSSFEQDPASVIATVMVLRAKEGAKCQSSNADDFEWSATRDFRKPSESCKLVKNDKEQLYTQTIKGDADVKLGFVVGSTNVNASYLYTLSYSNPIGYHVSSVSDCINFDGIRQDELPARVCNVRVVVGAVLTDIAYSAFEKTQLTAAVSYSSIVKIDGSYAGEVSSETHKFILSVDTRDLGDFFPAGADGFLHKQPAAIAVAKLDAVVDHPPTPVAASAASGALRTSPLTGFAELNAKKPSAPVVDFSAITHKPVLKPLPTH